MAFTRFNTAEGVASGTAVSSTNSGAGGYVVSGVSGTVTYSNAEAQSGSNSFLYATSGSNYVYWAVPPTAPNTLWFQSWVYFASLPTSGNCVLHGFNTTGGPFLESGIASTGKAFVNPGTVTNGTSTYVINTWYRFETEFFFNVTQCQITLRTYTNTGTLIETVTSSLVSAVNVTASVASFYGGQTASLYQDNLSVCDNGWIGGNTSFQLWKFNGAEGGTNGVALTTGNSGGLSGDAIDILATGTIDFSNAYAQSGSLSYYTAGTSAYTRINVPGTSTVNYSRAYIYFTTLPTSGYSSTPLYCLGDAGTHSNSLLLNGASGHWQVAGVAGTTTPVINTWYRIELQVNFPSGSSVVGRIYDNSGNLLETITSATGSTITVPQYLSWGAVSTGTGIYYLDNIAISDQGWIGANAGPLVLPATLSTSTAFSSPTVSGSASVASAGALSLSTTFPAPAFNSSVSIQPTTLSGTSLFGLPTVSGSANASPSALQGSVSFPASMIYGSGTVVPATLALGSTFVMATVSGSSNAVPSTLALSSSFSSTAFQSSVLITPQSLLATASFTQVLVLTTNGAPIDGAYLESLGYGGSAETQAFLMAMMTNLTAYQGNDTPFSLQVTQGGYPLNLAAYTPQLTVKSTSIVPDSSGTTYTTSSGLAVTNTRLGQLTFTLPHAATQTAGTQWWRLDVIDGSGNVSTSMYGNLYILAV